MDFQPILKYTLPELRSVIASLDKELLATTDKQTAAVLRHKSERIVKLLEKHIYLGTPYIALHLKYLSAIHLTITVLHLKPARMQKNVTYLREAILLRNSKDIKEIT